MPRKTNPRPLPPLPAVFPSFAGFPENRSQRSALEEELGRLAKRLRKRKPQTFYSMREVATFFKVQLRTVAIVYERLEKEGLINRVRGSQTQLVGLDNFSQHVSRGVVGIPIALFSFAHSLYSRALFIGLEERLRRKGFVAIFIFFEIGEDTGQDFAARLLRHNLDWLIWHTPHPLAAQTFLSLKEHGVRCIALQSMESSTGKIRPHYLMDWRPAYASMVRNWREEGINRVVTTRPERVFTRNAFKHFLNLLEAENFEIETTVEDAPSLLEAATGKDGTVVAFLDQEAADLLCNQHPHIIEQIQRTSRLAFCRGPISLPYFEHRPFVIDIVGFSPVEIADRIVSDLCQKSFPMSAQPYVFEATYRPRTVLSDASMSSYYGMSGRNRSKV